MSELSILDDLFRMFFEQSQGGYVLYGNKPICSEGILPTEENLFMVGDFPHRRSVLLKAGLRIWQTLRPESKKYYLHAYDNTSYGWREVLLINREEFLKVVKENLQLFQYVLGPEVTPEKLFEKMIDPKESFSSVFKDDKVLIGIVLGFGTQNALCVGREETISERPSETTPSFGFSSLQEEQDQLNKRLDLSIDLVQESSPPIPWFGCQKSTETEHLLQKYIKSQKTIRKALHSQHFLEEVLLCFFGSKKQVNDIIRRVSSNRLEVKAADWPFLIARAIVQGTPEKDREWMDAFVRGMRDNDQMVPLMSLEEWDHLRDELQDVNSELLTAEHTELRAKQRSLRQQEASQLGARTWAHFKVGQTAGYSLDAIVKALYLIWEKNPEYLSSEETDLLTDLHLLIYHHAN